MQKLSIVLATFFLFAFQSLPATCTYDQPLSLAELIDIALENHPSTKQAWWNANRAASAVDLAKTSYYPNVRLLGTANNGRDFKFINGPDTTYTIVGVDLFLDMLLLDFGERKAKVDMAKSALLASNWQLDWKIQKVMVDVLENAYNTILAQEVLRAAEISLSEAERMFNVARELNRAGLNAITDVYTAEATYFQMKMDLIDRQASLDIQRGRLASSVGLPANTLLIVAVPEITPCRQIEQVGILIDVAMEQRADLMAKQARLQELIYNQIRVKASYYPKLSVNSRAGFNKALTDDRARGGQYLISLNLNVPIFNGFETMYQNRMAYADTQIGNEDLAELQLEIAFEVLKHSRTAHSAQEMIPNADANLNNSIKAYEGVLEKYKAGKEGITEVSWAQRQLAQARVRYSEVKTKLLVSIANLAFATGTLVPYMETSCQENL